MTTEIAISKTQQLEVARKIDSAVIELFKAENITGFESLILKSNAVEIIESCLTAEIMAPIKKLAGKKVGFLTDRDKEAQSYSVEVIKSCITEALIIGLEVTGNQFNIIAGKLYVTKEGFSHLLRKIKGLKYDIIPQFPQKEGNTTYVTSEIVWSINGGAENRRIYKVPIKSNDKLGDDAILGKAERKNKAWLFNEITQKEFSDADVQDIIHEEVSSTTNKSSSDTKSTPLTVVSTPNTSTQSEEERRKRADAFLSNAKDAEDLKERLLKIGDAPYTKEKLKQF